MFACWGFDIGIKEVQNDTFRTTRYSPYRNYFLFTIHFRRMHKMAKNYSFIQNHIFPDLFGTIVDSKYCSNNNRCVFP